MFSLFPQRSRYAESLNYSFSIEETMRLTSQPYMYSPCMSICGLNNPDGHDLDIECGLRGVRERIARLGASYSGYTWTGETKLEA
jgi:hypothetical protein